MKSVNVDDVLKILHKYGKYIFVTDEKKYSDMVDEISNLKALEQEPKTGHWKAFIQNAYHGTDEDGEPVWREVTVYHCSQCNRRTVIKEKFCPNCGAKMFEPQEREEI